MGKKLFAGFIVVVLLMVVLAVYLTDVSQRSLQQAVGTHSILLAEEMLERINHDIYIKIEDLQSHLNDALVQKTIRHSNREFENLDNIQAYVDQMDRAWRQAPKNQVTPFMQALIHNELSNDLRNESVSFYNKKYGYKFFGEIIVTNKYGANVAQTGRTSDYRQNDETWWQIARDTGLYVSDIAYDVSAGIYAVSISVRIADEKGDFAGAIKAILAVKGIVRTAEIASKKYKTTEIKLTTKDGKLIYATKAFKILEDVSGKEYFNNIKGANGSFIAVEGGIKRLYSYTRSSGYRDFAGLGWILLVRHDVAEVLQPAIMLKNHMIAASLVLILLSMVIASFFYVFISKTEAQIHRQSAILDAINKVFRDALACDTEKDLALICLVTAEELTASKFGFIGEITPEGRFDCIALSDPGWGACRVPESQAPLLIKDMKMRGIWGRVLQDEKSLIANDPASHPDRASPPPGHPPITSFLGVPLQYSGKTIGLIALGNKKGGYTLHDQHAVETLSVAVVETLMRYRVEEELRKYRHHLEDLVEAHTAELKESNQQLLGFARGGKYEVKPSNLNELVKNSSEMFGRTKKEITIHSKFQESIWPVAIDRGQIDQVLLNLYVNAWHSMPGGGDLYIETENLILNKQYVEPYQKDAGRYVKIAITDTGIGMDKATQTKIFEPFFTTKEMGRGTGLGLASVYGIINNHDGFISVYSEKGSGTTFNIFLPISEKEVVEEKKPPDDILEGTETVLIVDDEQMIIDVSKSLLAKMGYNLLTAGGGKEALEIYKAYKHKIDLVILDMIMPDMGGSETFDQLKGINPDVKVLLSSGYSIDGQATEILERGCSGFIQKPFNIKSLSQKLREILDKK